MLPAPEGAPPPSGEAKEAGRKPGLRTRRADGPPALAARNRRSVGQRREGDMTAFRPKPFGTTAAPSGPRVSGHVTEEQKKAFTAEFDRRVMSFREKWRLCPGRLCRRKRQCLGPPFACRGKSWMPP